ncbi:carboxypeptidase-like regulatory domain-containing protein [Engelhardtia mirabilis]|uniref:Cortical protein marker for cell polarity n=1 Tax=Engelhardtia mirabilis TaxID=2528011 RepID=A0A518BH57_9BACT|nr:Cortical protein marker for cell polarity [Planctomycetes bacterium Pla133]QDV00638.1 Cortical protein marker for cell polarity [Planctomycetes bacterium Pla86]
MKLSQLLPLALSFAGLAAHLSPASAQASRADAQPPMMQVAPTQPVGDARHSTTLVGRAVDAGGDPVSGAVVFTNRGGQTSTDAQGHFELTLVAPPAGAGLTVTAAISIQGGNYFGTRTQGATVAGGTTHVGDLLLTSASACQPEWIPSFGGLPGMSDPVYAFAIFDDGSGSGPALFAGGSFTSAGPVSANRVAKWTGQTWESLGAGLNNSVHEMVVYDDGSGSGPALFVGGTFTLAGGTSASRIAKWDGNAWTALGTGLNEKVEGLVVHDDGSGSGPALFVAGRFTAAGGVAASRVAKWDGTTWSSLGSGVNNIAYAMVSHDDGGGAGPALYVGGRFTNAGGMAASQIARWDGTSWSTLGAGTKSFTLFKIGIQALAVFDDGSGSGDKLYAGGDFTLAGGAPASHIAQWDGSAWSPVGSGVSGTFGVNALTVHDDGSGAGPALYAGGDFTTAGSATANRLAKWDGSNWTALGDGVDQTAYALASFDDGSGAGSVLFAGGDLFLAEGIWCRRIAIWDGAHWSGLGDGPNAYIQDVAIFDDGSGSGPALYASGGFLYLGGITAQSIAKWDGSQWTPVGGGTNFATYALHVFDDGSGSGPALYAGGNFTTAGGNPALRVAKWDGSTWSPMGEGLSGKVNSLTSFDDGSGAGAQLYAAGAFQFSGATPALRVAKWDGSSWSQVGSGLTTDFLGILDLGVFDDGSGAGPALYAGGSVTGIAGQPTGGIAKWDGSSWSALGAGTNDIVLALDVFDDGSGPGPALIVGGRFTSVDGLPAAHIAAWDGTSWSTLGSGMDITSPTAPYVQSLVVHDDGSGSGPALYAGGVFNIAGGVPAGGVAKWDGSTWSPLGAGLGSGVTAMASWDDGSGAAAQLICAGSFGQSPTGSSFLAQWGCPGPGPFTAIAGCSGNPAQLSASSPCLAIGQVAQFALQPTQTGTGLAVLYAGQLGLDGNGCGSVLPGIGELLLAFAPAPVSAASVATSGGTVDFAIPVPNAPELVGLTIALQGVHAVVVFGGLGIEFSNALEAPFAP